MELLFSLTAALTSIPGAAWLAAPATPLPR
jgi:hypothetical protein